MERLDRYVAGLETLVEGTTEDVARRRAAALDGEPNLVLRSLVPIRDLRVDGAFFSGSALAQKLVALIPNRALKTVVSTDPTCGTGDLLVALSERLPVQGSLTATLRAWSSRLHGIDIHGTFVRAAKLRIVLAAIHRGVHVDCDAPTAIELLKGFRIGSSLDHPASFQNATHLLLNPPFGMMTAPDGNLWSDGSVSSAAVFLEQAFVHASPDTTVAAILPDVLRCGSRYVAWRQRIGQLASMRTIDPVGPFAANVDIDVFFFVGKKGRAASTAPWWPPAPAGARVLADLCTVSVGALVPHRSPRRGPWYPVFSAKKLPAWRVVRDAPSRRRFSGTTIDGPFVVVRRTARPGTGLRAVATVIQASGPVVVENHLIVLKPKDGRLSTCKEILDLLRRSATSAWLDRRTRCHHLTVAALKELPV